MKNEKKSYHHGDLRNSLIEAGIRIINENGENALSMRKVAGACNVSAAAPYAHFESKEDLIVCMQTYVTEKFTNYLVDAKKEASSASEAMLALGHAYIRFFLENKQYFTFLFHQPCFTINLSSLDNAENFPPFLLFKDCILAYNQQMGKDLSQDDLELDVISLWAHVHGIVSIASMKHVTWEKRWEDELINLVR